MRKDTIINIKQTDLQTYNFDEYEDNSFDGLISDAPYELNFMNKGWDNTGIAFNKEFWGKTLRVLKPGAYALVFGGSRTHHRLMVALEDAGFIIRDVLFYIYGSGFPKSYNISKGIDKKFGVKGEEYIREDFYKKSNKKEQHYSQCISGLKGVYNKPATLQAELWDGYGTNLKPSYEPIILVQKPIEGNYVNNVLKYNVGGLNIDGCRVAPTGERLGEEEKKE